MRSIRNKLFILLGILLFTIPLLAQEIPANSLKTIAISKLKKHDGKKLHYSVIGQYESQNELILLTATHPSKDDSCHACGVDISFFIFKNNILQNSYINAIELGSYGQAPKKDELSIKRLNGGVLSLLYTSFFSTQGIDGHVLNIYKVGDTKVSKILQQQISMNNEASGFTPIKEWNSTYKLDENSNILLNIKGTIGQKVFEKKVILKFNGTKYENKKIEI